MNYCELMGIVEILQRVRPRRIRRNPTTDRDGPSHDGGILQVLSKNEMQLFAKNSKFHL